MSEGPTTVGSIVGKLRLDISDWVAKAEEAKAVVREIGAADPRVKFRLEGTEEAVAKLGAVRAAEADVERGSKKMGESGNSAGAGMGVLWAALANVSLAAPPVAAGAVAITGAFGVMAGVGVLAVLGIKKAMGEGTTEGDHYRDAIESVSTQLNSLERVAASGVLKGVEQSVRTLNGYMPSLTADTAVFSQQLGSIASNSLDGLLSMLRQMSPLLQTAGQYLVQVSAGFQSMSGSQGFRDFLAYTEAALPRVEEFLGAVVRAVGQLVAAWGNVGVAALPVLTTLLNLIADLPLPILQGLIIAVTGVYTAFQSWKLISGIVAGAAAAVEAFSGPIGWVSLAVGALITVFAAVGASAQSAAGAVGDFSSAVEQDNGAIGENVRAMAAKSLADQRVLSDGKLIGLSAKTVTDATLGNVDAYAKMTAAVNKASDANKTIAAGGYTVATGSEKQAAAAEHVKAAVDASRKALTDAVNQYNLYTSAVGKSASSLDQMKAKAAAVHMPVQEFIAAATANAKVAAQAQLARDKMILEGNAAGVLKMDLDKLNGATISNAEAQASWVSGLDSLASGFSKDSKAITGNTHAAIENRGAIAQQVAVGQTALTSLADTTHSASQVTAAYKSMRAQLISQITAITGNKKAATEMVDEFFKIPKNIKTDFKGNDADAKAKAASAKKAGQDFAKGDYKAALKADPSPANKAKAEAMKNAEAFALKKYQAQYEANPTKANLAAYQAALKAHGFATGFYEAKLRADASGALAGVRTAQGSINSLHGKTVDVTVRYATVGHVGMKAEGGTIGVPGAADGTTAIRSNSARGFAGQVRGPGTAFNDMAGMYRLANGEEVISNMRGQADQWRPLLKAINSGRMDYGQFMSALGGGGNTPVSVRTIAPEIHIHNPVSVDPVQQATEAVQYALAYANL